MATADELLANAERLTSDSQFLFAAKRTRSAATLIVVALEQLGAFVELSTQERYPDAKVHLGIFGKGANSHARRQDALAARVMHSVMGRFAIESILENYLLFCLADGRKFEQADFSKEEFVKELAAWVNEGNGELTAIQQQRQRECPDFRTAHLLLHYVRTNRLKALREFGLYEHVEKTFSDEEIANVIELTGRVREILSMSEPAPDVVRLAGINMPEAIILDGGDSKPKSLT